MPRDVWYAIPSANPELARETLPAWRDMGYNIAVLLDAGASEVPADATIWRDAYPGWAASVNLLCDRAVPRDAAIVVSGGDDMLPDPARRADEIAEEFYDRFPDGFGVMQPHGDDFADTRSICGSPWLGRAWIDRAYAGMGPMPSMYFHDFADTELYWVSKCLGALWERPDLTQRHDHFTRRGEEAPAYWNKSVGAHRACDAMVFHARARALFPGHTPIGDARPFDVDRFRREHVERVSTETLEANGLRVETGVGVQRLRDALLYCDTMGHERVGIYGAGRHTRQAGMALAHPPVEVVCVIDDGALAGGALWGIPVCDRAGAAELRLDAVILSSDTFEAALAERAQPLAEGGAEIVSLYGLTQTGAA